MAQRLREEANAAFQGLDFSKALSLYTDAIDISPEEAVLYSNRAAAYIALKDFSNALADALKATSLDPAFVRGWVRLGFAHLNLKNFSDSRLAFQRALLLDPQNPAARQGLDSLPSAEPQPRQPQAAQPQSAGQKRKLDETEKTRAELIEELYAAGPMKIKNELVKRLNEFPASKNFETIDSAALARDLEPLSKTGPFAFLCARCDKAKISALLGTWKKENFLCHACLDHLTRCVLPVRDLPPHLRPEKCIHQVPKGYQKLYRS